MRTKTAAYGYLMVDHRASPGLPEDVARHAGYDPRYCGEGKLYEAVTLGCWHCGTHVVPNPLRERDRAWCMTCDKYICDWCDAARNERGYVHYNCEQVSDMITSGKWTNVGTVNRPILVQK